MPKIDFSMAVDRLRGSGQPFHDEGGKLLHYCMPNYML